MLSSTLSVRQLSAFVAVYRLRKITAAATLLSVTPSAVSVLIRQIERSVGLQLFDRSTRSLEPTHAAHEAIGVAESILRDLEGLSARFRDLGERRSGLVHVAATPAISAALLPSAVRSFVRAHPHVRVVLDDCPPNQFVSRILSGQVEFGIGTPDGDVAGIETRTLIRDHLCVVCPDDHPLAEMRTVRWAQLAGLPVIAGTPGYGVRKAIDTAAARTGTALRIANEVNFLTSALWMVASGLGVAIFPSALATLPQHPNLVARPLAEPRVLRDISLVSQQGRSLSPAAERFVSMLLQDMVERNVVGLLPPGKALQNRFTASSLPIVAPR